MKPSEILEAISKLDGEQVELLFASLDRGMWDEWDCGFFQSHELGFGGFEFAFAAKAASQYAKATEENIEGIK
jgi:hypothetical protein